MRPAATVRVQWTRAELLALREAIEVTPNFEGRQDVLGECVDEVVTRSGPRTEEQEAVRDHRGSVYACALERGQPHAAASLAAQVADPGGRFGSIA